MNISYTLKGVIKSSIGHFCQNLKEGAHEEKSVPHGKLS